MSNYQEIIRLLRRIFRKNGAICLTLSISCIFLLYPHTCRSELIFLTSSQSLSWADYQPERTEEIAPVINLSGEWEYQVGNDHGSIIVPSCYFNYEGKVQFSRQFIIPEEWRGRPLSFHFLGIQHRASIYLNDQLLESRESNGIPLEIAVPERSVRFGIDNILTVEVDNRKLPLSSLPLKSSLKAPRNYGGIFREVLIAALPKERISSLNVEEVADDDPASTTLLVEYGLETSHEGSPLELQLEIFNSEGKQIFRREIVFEDTSEITGSEKIHLESTDLVHWSPHYPSYYRLRCKLERNKILLDAVEKKFGIRAGVNQNDPQVLADSLLTLLGQSNSRWGVTRVEEWSNTGITASRQQLEDEIALIQMTGAYFVRCAFFPPHPYLLHLCDSLGIGVFVEIPLFGVPNKLLNKIPVQAAAITAMKQLQELAKYHPCVLALGWGSGFEPEALVVGETIDRFIERVESDLPFYAQSIGIVSEKTNLLILSSSIPEGSLCGNQFLELNVSRKTDQHGDPEYALGNEIVNQLSLIKGSSYPILVNTLSDWRSDRPLLYNPPPFDAYAHYTGITDEWKTPRRILFQIQGLFAGEDIELRKSEEKSPEENPPEFLITGLLFCAFGLWMIRFDKLFKMNMRRSLSHFARFFGDIRDRRFLQESQTFILTILISAGMGIFMTSIAYEIRSYSDWNILISHLISNHAILEFLRNIFWFPGRGILFVGVGILFFTIGSAIVIMLFGSYGSARLSIAQSLDLFYWGFVPALLVLPLSTFYLRLDQIPMLGVSLVIIVFILLCWSYVRLVRALRIVYSRGYGKPLLVGFSLPLFFLFCYIVHLQITRHSLDYIPYFIAIFSQ